MSSGQCRFSLESLCRGCGEEEEKEPHGLHAQELDEVDPDVVDDVHRGEDVPGQDQVTAWGIMANMVLCVIPGQGNSKILNLVKSGSFDSPIFLYIPNDEKTSTGHLI